MEVGEEDLTLVEEVIFGLKGLFYLNNHFGTIKQSLLVRENLSTNSLVIGIRETAADTGTLFNQDRVTSTAHRLNTRGGHTDAELIVFDFLRNANNHVFFLLLQIDKNTEGLKRLGEFLKVYPIWDFNIIQTLLSSSKSNFF